jgi:hypothetical protein
MPTLNLSQEDLMRNSIRNLSPAAIGVSCESRALKRDSERIWLKLIKTNKRRLPSSFRAKLVSMRKHVAQCCAKVLHNVAHIALHMLRNVAQHMRQHVLFQCWANICCAICATYVAKRCETCVAANVANARNFSL